MKSAPNCYEISARKPFLGHLASWLLAQAAKSGRALTDTLVFLPNHRACLGLREAFLDCTGGKPLLLPRIQPIGEMEEEGLFAHHPLLEALPPAIDPLRRQFLLARLIAQFGARAFGEHGNIQQSLTLARQLAGFIDEAAREGVGFERLSALAPDDLQRHWQQTVEFLTLISRHWPRLLQEEGALDPVERRNRQLRLLAAQWERYPPAFPVVAAGSTGSQPATAELLAVIARLPEGKLVLAGLDRNAGDEEWEQLPPSHPQFALKQLLQKIGCPRIQVRPLGQAPDDQPLPEKPDESARLRVITASLQPAEMTPRWKQAALNVKSGIQGIRVLSADTQLEEARLIAALLRETLETPRKTAALVTPDRTLARLVVAQMQRFGIAVDDSAGRPLADTPPAVFMRLCADALASRAAPAPLLALLRHPLCAAGRAPSECRALSRELEVRLLRGVRRKGLDALLAAAAPYLPVQALLRDIAGYGAAFDVENDAAKPVHEWLSAHVSFAQAMAKSDEEKGEHRLWAKDAGNQLAAFLAQLLKQAPLLGDITREQYPGVFEAFLAAELFRPAYGAHPRLRILSPMEARMVKVDRVILGELNEGVWPALPAPDPWMSRPMREAFGLPSPDRAIGQSAHDFYMLCGCPEVVLMRARKIEGVPTVPSRWLTRLQTLVEGLDKDALAMLMPQADADRLLATFNRPAAMTPPPPPAPTPPLAARPRKMRVTAMENWRRDPYMVYAQYVLCLHELRPLDEDPGAADFGSLVHRVLEEFTQHYAGGLPPQPLGELLRFGRKAFSGLADRPAVQALWWPRFEAMAKWFIDREGERRHLGHVFAEISGEWRFGPPGREFTLTTKIDRIQLQPGQMVISDYKTGALPDDKEIKEGLACQLPLEALVVTHGTLSADIAAAGRSMALEYWKLAGSEKNCEIKPVDVDIDQARRQLNELIADFDNPATPYAAPPDNGKLPRYNAYEHLTRREEWEGL